MPAALNPPSQQVRQQMSGGSADDPPALLNHPTQSATAIDGWKSFFFGLPFLACGIFMMAGAFNMLHGRKSAPTWLIVTFGSFFLFGGLFFSIHGLLGVIRKAAYHRHVAAHPGQPWLADYHWRPDGISFSAFRSMLGRLAGVIVWYAFLVPFGWVGLNVRGPGRLFLVVSVLFGLIGLFFWARWLQMLRELLRYGSSYLAYDSFPYFIGGTVQARLRVSRHFDSLDDLTITLRCVQEKYVTSGQGKNRSTNVVCYELYSDVATFTHEQLAGAASSYLPISFRLPDNEPTTRLTDTPPTYWQIEARGQAHGGGYEAYFLLPVYCAASS